MARISHMNSTQDGVRGLHRDRALARLRAEADAQYSSTAAVQGSYDSVNVTSDHQKFVSGSLVVIFGAPTATYHWVFPVAEVDSNYDILLSAYTVTAGTVGSTVIKSVTGTTAYADIELWAPLTGIVRFLRLRAP